MGSSAARKNTVVLSAICVIAVGCYRQVPVSSGGAAESSASKQPADDGMSKVALRFQWPGTLRLEATSHIERRRNDQKLAEYDYSYDVGVDLDVESESSGLQLTVSWKTGDRAAFDTYAPAGRWVVDPDGRFDTFKSSDLPASARHRSRRWWSGMAGAWTGRAVQLGWSETFESDARIRLPVVGRKQMPVDTMISARRHQGCSNAEATCVSIETAQKPHVHMLRHHLQSWVDQYAEKLAVRRGLDVPPELTVDSVFAEYTTILVTTTDQLIPQRRVSRRLVRMTMSTPNQQTTKTWKFVESVETEFRAVFR